MTDRYDILARREAHLRGLALVWDDAASWGPRWHTAEQREWFRAEAERLRQQAAAIREEIVTILEAA